MTANTDRGTEPTWLLAWSQRRFRWALSVSLLVAALSPLLLPVIYASLDRRPGWVPPDPVLHRLPPEQVSWAIFGLLFPTLILVVVSCLVRPWVLIRGGLACAVMYALRAATMTLIPLAAPTDLIALRDPIGQLFYPGKLPETRDLFFSGHTAIMFLLVRMVRTRLAKVAVTLAATAVGMLLLIQHAHWTIDVLAAPVFAALCWHLSGKALRHPTGHPPVLLSRF